MGSSDPRTSTPARCAPSAPGSVTPTRISWHTIAEHIVAPARHRATGRIGLRPTPGGFGSPWFPAAGDDGDDERRIRVDGDELVVEERGDDGSHFERRERISTLRAAGAVVGIEPGAPSEVYEPITPLDLDFELAVAARSVIGLWPTSTMRDAPCSSKWFIVLPQHSLRACVVEDAARFDDWGDIA